MPCRQYRETFTGDKEGFERVLILPISVHPSLAAAAAAAGVERSVGGTVLSANRRLH